MTDPADRAYQLLELGRARDAVRAASEAVRQRPHDPYPMRVLASALLQAGDVDEALVTVRRACALDPMDALSHRVRARCHIERGEHWLARPAVEESLRLDPHDARTYDVLSDVELAAGNADAARAAAGRCLALAPLEPFAHFAVGYVALRTGRRAEAAAAFERVLAMDPHHTEAMHNLAIARGDNVESTKLLTHVVRLRPDSSVSVRVLDERLHGAVVAYVVGTLFAFGAMFTLTEGFGLPTPVAVGMRLLVPVVTTALFVRHLRRLPEGARRLLASRLRRFVPGRRYRVPLVAGGVLVVAGLAVPATREAVWPTVLGLVGTAFWLAIVTAGRGGEPRPVARPHVGPVTPEAFAPMGKRVAAAVIDTVATLLVGGIVVLPFTAAGPSERLVGLGVFAAIALALPLLTARRWGATVGQREAGIAVVDVWTGQPVETRRRLRRMAWWWLSWATFGAGWWSAWRGRPSMADRRTTSAVVRRGTH